MSDSRGFDEALADWKRLVVEVERGYELTIDDYTNDLCARDRLEELVAAAPGPMQGLMRERLAPWDERFFAASEDAHRPLLRAGEDEPSYWWWVVPKKRSGEFERDLADEGLVVRQADADRQLEELRHALGLPHNCKGILGAVDDERVPFRYRKDLGEFCIERADGTAFEAISYCPWCGQGLPTSTRGSNGADSAT